MLGDLIADVLRGEIAVVRVKAPDWTRSRVIITNVKQYRNMLAVLSIELFGLVRFVERNDL